MAEVFANEMVAHVWAQGRQESGRSHNGNLFFTGAALYSYGSHFVVGYLMPDGVALLNADSYSMSTSRHQSEALHATRHLTQYRVPDLTELVRYWPRLNDAAFRKAARADIVAYVEKHVLALTELAAAYLLQIAQSRRSVESVRARAERKAAASKAEQRKRELAVLKAHGQRWARMPWDEFSDHVSETEQAEPWGKFPSPSTYKATEWRRGTPSESLALFARELFRATKAPLGKRDMAALKARLKSVRARVKQLAAWEAHGAYLAAYSRSLADMRALYAQRPLTRHLNRALIDHARVVLTTRPGLLTAHATAALQSLIRDCLTIDKEHAERENAERMEREAAARAQWLAGIGFRHWSGSDSRGGALLRAVDVERDASGIVGGTLQTSHGADVPLVHALKAFAYVRRVVASGRPWQANGHTIHVGHFRVDSIDIDGTMKAGCHTIHLAEMERLAAALGVMESA